MSFYSEQNEQIIKALQDAYSASLQLISDGFTIINVKIDHGKPLLEIEYQPECAVFKICTVMNCKNEDGTHQRHTTLVKNTRVQWLATIH